MQPLCGLEAERRGAVTASGFLRPIELLGLGLGDAIVVVASRRGHDVDPGSLVYPFGQDIPVEHHRHELVAQVINSHSVPERQRRLVHGIHGCTEILLAEARNKLIAAIMMVYAVGKPHAHQVLLEGGKLLAAMVYGAVGVDGLEGFPYLEVVFAELVECDVAPIERGLRKAIDILLLAQ